MSDTEKESEIREHYTRAYRSAYNFAIRDTQERHSRAHMYAVAQLVAAGTDENEVYGNVADLMLAFGPQDARKENEN